MPVQFLSGGGGGGGTSDVRTTFANPTSNTAVFPASAITTQVLNTFTIPANYLQVNDCLSFTSIIKKITTTGLTSSKSVTLNIRMGTTGTVSDTLIGTLATGILVYPAITEYCWNITGYVGIKTTGSSGTCFTYFQSENFILQRVGCTNNGLKTIDTTVPLYITVYATISMSVGQSATLAPTSSAIAVGF